MSKAPLFLLHFQKGQGMARMSEQVVPEQRVLPRQQRSLATVEVILEAAAQVLEIAGEAGFMSTRQYARLVDEWGPSADSRTNIRVRLRRRRS